MSLASPVTLLRAADFAARRHADQRRKGESAEPYLNHLIEVASLLAETTGGGDETLLVGELLHDAIEDVGVTEAEIGEGFGDEVLALVREVTDDKSLPKEQRKRLQIETAPRKSDRAKLLKVADKTSNLRAMAVSPPAGWPLDRIRAYVDWAEAVVAGCRGLEPALDALFDDAVVQARARIAEQAAAENS